MHYLFLYFFIAAFAKIRLGSKNNFEDFIVLKDLKANIAIGSSVHPKIIFLQLIEKNANVVALNIPDFDINNIETYLKYDSVQNYNTDWNIKIVNESMFKINNKLIHILNSRTAKDLNWRKYGVNYLIDASGVYLTHDKAKEHNVDYVIMCAPPKDNTPSED